MSSQRRAAAYPATVGTEVTAGSALLNLSAILRCNHPQVLWMTPDIRCDKGTRRNYFQLFASRIFQRSSGQVTANSLSLVFLWYLGVEQIQPAIGLRVVNLCDLLSKRSFEAVRRLISANWMISH